MSETQNQQAQYNLTVVGFFQKDLDQLFTEIAEQGALTFFTKLRDEALLAGDKLMELAASENQPASEEIKRRALSIRNDIIIYTTAVDKSFEFESITSSEGRSIN